jgi:ParB family chromosome partitioning protein
VKPTAPTPLQARLGNIRDFGKAGAQPLAVNPIDRNNKLQEIATHLVDPDPDQPRKHFDTEEMAQLEESIRRLGIIQPILVTPADAGRYRVVAGERRFTAAQAAGLKTIPAKITTATGIELKTMQAVENLHRSDLTPLEEANLYHVLITEFGLSQTDVAERFQKGVSRINESLRLLEFTPEQQETIQRAGKKLSATVLVELSKAPKEQHAGLIEQAASGLLTAAAARTIAKKGAPDRSQHKRQPSNDSTHQSEEQPKSGVYVSVTERGDRVSVLLGPKRRGKRAILEALLKTAEKLQQELVS